MASRAVPALRCAVEWGTHARRARRRRQLRTHTSGAAPREKAVGPAASGRAIRVEAPELVRDPGLRGLPTLVLRLAEGEHEQEHRREECEPRRVASALAERTREVDAQREGQ